MRICYVEGKVLASIKLNGQVFLICSPSYVLAWDRPKQALKYFKKLYSAVFSLKEEVEQFHLLADIRLHFISNKALENDSFENAIVKAPVDADKSFSPEDHSIAPIDVYGVSTHGILCLGDGANSWHSSGIRPKFPKMNLH